MVCVDGVREGVTEALSGAGAGAGAEGRVPLPKMPSKGFRRLVSLRVRVGGSSSGEGRCTAEADWDKGEGVLVL